VTTAKIILRIVLSMLAGLAGFILTFPMWCADSASPCTTLVGTRIPEFWPVLTITVAVVVGYGAWLLLGLTPLRSKQ